MNAARAPKSKAIRIRAGLSGRFRMIVHKGDAEGNPIPGTARHATGWCNNLITDGGLNQIGRTSPYEGGWNRGLLVGSGSTTPANSDTTLATRVAGTTTVQSDVVGRDLVASPAYTYHRRVWRFGTGVAAGNLTEVGIVMGNSTGTGTNGAMNPTAYALFSRALIVDGLGSPTSVTVLSDEVLDVEYEIRMYIPSADVTGTITLDGVDYAYTVRPWEIDQVPTINGGGWYVSGANNSGSRMEHRDSTGHGENPAYVGAAAEIGSQTTEPAGTRINTNNSAGGAGLLTAAYSDGSLYVDYTITWSLGTASVGINIAGGIGVQCFSYSLCSFQVGFEPHIPKDHTQVFSLTLRVTWGRY